MKKTIITILSVFFLLFFTGLFFLINIKRQEEEAALKKIENYNLEDFNFLENRQKAKKSQLILFFSSTCALCDHEAVEVSAKAAQFKSTDLTWVSAQPTDSIKVFAQRNNLYQDGISLAQLPDSLYQTKYQTITPPHMLLYYKGKLVKQYKGITSPAVMLEDIEKQEKEAR